MKKPLIVFLAISMPGCINVATMSGTQVHNVDCSASRAFEAYWPKGYTGNPGSTEMLAMLGGPVKVEKTRTIERWYYPNGHKWRGLVPILGVIPVPLEVPVGKDYFVVNVVNGQCASVDDQADYRGTVMCGLYWPEATAMLTGDLRSSKANYNKPSRFFGIVTPAIPNGMEHDIQIQFRCGFEHAWKTID